MKPLLEALARALVTDPSRVVVTQSIDEEGVLLELEVAPADLGRVIGRRGRTAESLRIVLDAVAEKHGTNCDVEILD